MKYCRYMNGFSFLLLSVLTLGLAGTSNAETRRADLLKMHSEYTPQTSSAVPLFQDIGGSSSPGQYGEFRADVARPMFLSLLMPGLGEASMGYKRGYMLMALDIASWFSVSSAHKKGGEIRDQYFDFADAHWSLPRLHSAFGGSQDFVGTFYYEVITEDNLSLWVSEEDDRREYYENLGKWDQFVFGWDDFIDPRGWVGTEATAADLSDSRVSANREFYRSLRIDSNDQYSRRDLLIKINMGTRLLSMLQVAWLKGVFGNDNASAMMSVAGHDLTLINQTRGLSSGRIGLSLSY